MQGRRVQRWTPVSHCVIGWDEAAPTSLVTTGNIGSWHLASYPTNTGHTDNNRGEKEENYLLISGFFNHNASNISI